MRLGFYLGLACTALVGMTISGAQIWASVVYFGVMPTLGMYMLALIAVAIQVWLTTRAAK